MLRLWLSNAANSMPIRGCLPNAVNSVQMGGGASQMLQIACTWGGEGGPYHWGEGCVWRSGDRARIYIYIILCYIILYYI